MIDDNDILGGPDREGSEDWRANEPPLTEAEIRAWLENLAPSDTQRATRIKDMLKHAGEDGMSLANKTICHSALRRLETKSSLRRTK